MSVVERRPATAGAAGGTRTASRLYRATGDAAKADSHLTTAATMYREMDMGFWLEKAHAELRGVER